MTQLSRGEDELMTMKPWLMLAAGTVLAGAALAGCGGAGGSGTATGSRTAGPSGRAAGSASPARTPAASGTSATVPASAAARSAAVAACTTSDLRISVALSLRSDDKLHTGLTLQLTNSSRQTCALDGYPGLRLLDSRRQVLHTVTHRGSTWYADDPGRKLVDLAPGQAAQTGLGWTHADSRAVSASYLEVTPPGSTTHLTVSFRQLVDGGDLDVTALARTVPLGF
jgi:uncharacterized protein DUF4232